MPKRQKKPADHPSKESNARDQPELPLGPAPAAEPTDVAAVAPEPLNDAAADAPAAPQGDAVASAEVVPPRRKEGEKVQDEQAPLAQSYRDWFLDYASYVILDRAVPHIDDGLKPVQRRVLHTLWATRPAAAATSSLFDRLAQAPAVQSLARCLEHGGALSCTGVSAPAQPFLAALLHQLFPQRPIVLIADSLKTQEWLQQDVGTWLQVAGSKLQAGDAPSSTLFYPAWEILPHESKLPHSDVISDRLETLIALTHRASRITPPVITNVIALLQRTFPPTELTQRTRILKRGDRTEPLDLVEWLEAQGYEPEAQVSSKGELSLRGGILDIFPPTCPWPVRLEFFGDELESLREFDPQTQISRDEITSITLPPAGELGILKQALAKAAEAGHATNSALSTLLDYLPRETLLLLCESQRLEERAAEYATQVPAGDPFFIPWAELRAQAEQRGMTVVELSETDFSEPTPDPSQEGNSSSNVASSTDTAPLLGGAGGGFPRTSDASNLDLNLPTLDAFRPLSERLPEPQIAEAQRHEFFSQLHRWLRQDYAVHVFCNNDGERQRFTEIWTEQGFANSMVEDDVRSLTSKTRNKSEPPHVGTYQIEIGTLARGFISDEAKLVIVTDAEIFGRYKRQQPRRLKSAHAQATRSALDIDFTELEEGDLVVHLQDRKSVV